MKKTLFCVMLLVVCFNCMAQHYPFIRIFDLQGKKIYKGRLISITDRSLILKDSIEIMITDIGKIKTKRSTGNSIGMGALIGFGTVLSIGLIDMSANDGYRGSTGEVDGMKKAVAIVIGPFLGTLSGALIGGVGMDIVKSSQTFKINGSLENWSTFKQWMEKNYK
jgi:hypothetical protein